MLTSDFATLNQILTVAANALTTNTTLQQAAWNNITLTLNGHTCICYWQPGTSDWNVVTQN